MASVIWKMENEALGLLQIAGAFRRVSNMLITNARLITWGAPGRILENHALYIEGARIGDLGPSSDLRKKYPQAAELDARGQYVAPGNICAHTHFYGAFARGMAIPGDPPKDFPEILERLWWRLDKRSEERRVGKECRSRWSPY